MSVHTVVRRSFRECCELIHERLADAQRDFSKRMRSQHASTLSFSSSAPSMGRMRHAAGSDSSNAEKNAANLLTVMDHSSRLHDSLHSIRVPREEIHHNVPDFPAFLLSRVRKQSGVRFNASMSDDRIINDFTEWLDMYSPSLTSQVSVGESRLRGSTALEGETISALALLNYIDSFCHYHNGVMWDRDHSGGYVLHPWHFQFSPEHRCEQMPYVHMLQWLNANHNVWRGNSDAFKHNQELLFGSTNAGPSALDLTCQSGFAADLLLKSGVKRLLCADRDEWALANCEATVREHMREKRSGGLAKEKLVSFTHCDPLPDLEGLFDELRRSQAESSENESSDRRGFSKLNAKTSAAVNAAAAKRRRTQGRKQSRFASDSAGESRFSNTSTRGKVDANDVMSNRREIARQLEIQSRFDLLCFHPPINRCVLGSPLDSYHHFIDRQTRITGQTERMLGSILNAVTLDAAVDSLPRSSERGSCSLYPLLSDESVITFVVPRSYSVLSGNVGTGDSGVGLSEIILSRMEESTFSFEVLLHRPHSMFPLLEEVSGLKSLLRKSFYPPLIKGSQSGSRNVFAFPWLNSGNNFGHTCVSTANPFSAIPLLLDASVCPEFVQSVSEQIVQHYQEQSVDLLIVKRKARRSIALASFQENQLKESGSLSAPTQAKPSNVTTDEESFVDTLEYNEYLPREGPTNPFHWFAQVPSYSYLEDRSDFKRGGRNAAEESHGNHVPNYHPNSLIASPPSSPDPLNSSNSTVLTDGYEGLQHNLQVNYAKATRVEATGASYDDNPLLHSSTTGNAASSASTSASSSVLSSAIVYRNASQRFNTLFQPEMRRMRQKRMRRMATEAPEKQDWYLDEKFIKSSAAKLDLMNELMRFDLREPE